MKKILFVVAIAIAVHGNVNAQNVKIGVKVGLNLANLTDNFVGDDSDIKIGFNSGLFAEISLSDKFIFQPELLFSKQGAKNEETNYSLKLNYLNIPLMIKNVVADKFAFEFGPQIGFLLSANKEYEATSSGETVSDKLDVKDYYKSIDFGLNFGATFDVSEKVIIGARYNVGLSNIIDDEDTEKDLYLKNSVFSMSVGYRF